MSTINLAPTKMASVAQIQNGSNYTRDTSSSTFATGEQGDGAGKETWTNYYRVYTRFDLSSYSSATISTARIYLRFSSFMEVAYVNQSASEIDPETGTISSVWNSAAGTQLGSLTADGSFYYRDVTTYVNSHKGGDCDFGLVGSGEGYLNYVYSDNATEGYRPYLYLDYSDGGSTSTSSTSTSSTSTSLSTSSTSMSTSRSVSTSSTSSSTSTSRSTSTSATTTTPLDKITAYDSGDEPSYGDWSDPINCGNIPVGDEGDPIPVVLKAPTGKDYTGNYTVTIDGTYASRYNLSDDGTNWEGWGLPLTLSSTTIDSTTGVTIYVKKRALEGDPGGDSVRACLKVPYVECD
jgi:hypothetical protein